VIVETAETPDLLRRITIPLAITVAIVVALAWLLTWASSDWTMDVLGMGGSLGGVDLALFFVLMVVMMIAMMLPSALPMVLAFAGMTRLEAGRPTKPVDLAATAAFVGPYFLVWGAFAVASLLGIVALALLDTMMGPVMEGVTFVPAAVLIAAGGWQVTRTKEICLTHCESPMTFVVQHWRSGPFGPVRMGLRHAGYCIGCCWLFMLVLFVAGTMSLVWMGGIALAIFIEKTGWKPEVASRGIGVVLVVLGLVVAANVGFAM
jgi:predicted metal-binding membrane protein